MKKYGAELFGTFWLVLGGCGSAVLALSLIHISEPTRLLSSSYAVFCLKKKNKKNIFMIVLIYPNQHKCSHTIT